MPLTVRAYSGLGPGAHDVVVTDCKEKVSEKFGGTYLRWEFTDEAGDSTSANTAAVLTPGNKPGKWFAAVTGRPTVVGEDREASEVIGKPCSIFIEENAEGYAKVISVTPRTAKAPRRQTANLTPAENAAVQHALQEGDDLPF